MEKQQAGRLAGRRIAFCDEVAMSRLAEPIPMETGLLRDISEDHNGEQERRDLLLSSSPFLCDFANVVRCLFWPAVIIQRASNARDQEPTPPGHLVNKRSDLAKVDSTWSFVPS